MPLGSPIKPKTMAWQRHENYASYWSLTTDDSRIGSRVAKVELERENWLRS